MLKKLSFFLTLSVTLFAGWMFFIHQTTGKGRPVCLSNFSQPSEQTLIRYRVWYHVQNLSERRARLYDRALSLSRFDPDAPVDHAAIDEFLSKYPECCRINAPGDGMGKYRRAADLFFGREYVSVSLRDPTLKTPEGYQQHYSSPPIHVCDKNLERMQ